MKRNSYIIVRASLEEVRAVKGAAKVAGVEVSTFVRRAILRAISAQFQKQEEVMKR